MILAAEAKRISETSLRAYGHNFDIINDLIYSGAQSGETQVYFYRSTLSCGDKLFDIIINTLEKAGYYVYSMDGDRYTICWGEC